MTWRYLLFCPVSLPLPPSRIRVKVLCYIHGGRKGHVCSQRKWICRRGTPEWHRGILNPYCSVVLMVIVAGASLFAVSDLNSTLSLPLERHQGNNVKENKADNQFEYIERVVSSPLCWKVKCETWDQWLFPALSDELQLWEAVKQFELKEDLLALVLLICTADAWFIQYCPPELRSPRASTRTNLLSFLW